MESPEKLNLKHNTRLQFDALATKIEALFAQELRLRENVARENFESDLVREVKLRDTYWQQCNALKALLERIAADQPLPPDLLHKVRTAIA